MADHPQRLTDKGARIVARGGQDGFSDDDMLVLEIAKRAPGASRDDIKAFFIALREEFGEEALRAIRTGHAVFEERKPQ